MMVSKDFRRDVLMMVKGGGGFSAPGWEKSGHFQEFVSFSNVENPIQEQERNVPDPCSGNWKIVGFWESLVFRCPREVPDVGRKIEMISAGANLGMSGESDFARYIRVIYGPRPTFKDWPSLSGT